MTTSPRSDCTRNAGKLLTFAVVGLVLLSYSAVSSSPEEAGTHTIEDARGEGSEARGLSVHVTPPEVDIWWADAVPFENALEVSVHVANLSHRTFAPNLEGIAFSCAWGIRYPNGYGDVQDVSAQYGTFNGIDHWTVFRFRDSWINSTSTHDIAGEFDWANNTVRVHVPISYFESGSTLINFGAWSSADTQNKVGLHLGYVEFDDRAPDPGYARSDVHIP